ncbi:ImmA/IrrE family metallo-endopeptidase [Enterococcus devriesei]|uniref:IrrE N-terminal-like domain-containing protein n=1 Tax=Enterococcus devriesei TaxID=319970 RepID=A0A1L8SUP1_9ENTE|nr:ImmA/IrrE family metallo-endopeptidase [Enterococcus devriesei]OJG35592.1 hypothetical protein RV00_GL002777 [Enterococcus devriesei]
MNYVEKLMSQFPQLEYKFEKEMPAKHKGLCVDNIVYLNPNQTNKELSSTLAEEIAHYYTSVGDISDYKTPESRKQERRAKLVAAEMTVHPALLINAYQKGCREYWEVADELGITVGALKEAIELFRQKYGEGFNYEGFNIIFGSSDSIRVVKLQ